MAFSQDLIGQQFGNYRLIRRLGAGGFASVYLGQHVRLPAKQAAIKILDLRDVDEQQFQQEAETTERLVHPNIVRLLDFDVQHGTPFLVLDYAPEAQYVRVIPKAAKYPLLPSYDTSKNLPQPSNTPTTSISSTATSNLTISSSDGKANSY